MDKNKNIYDGLQDFYEESEAVNELYNWNEQEKENDQIEREED